MRKIALLFVVFVSLLMVGCAITSVEDIEKEDMIGKKVIVKGEVLSSFKFGSLSGYTLELSDGDIFVSSDDLPEEGKTKMVSGTVSKSILGYYIDAKDD